MCQGVGKILAENPDKIYAENSGEENYSLFRSFLAQNVEEVGGRRDLHSLMSFAKNLL